MFNKILRLIQPINHFVLGGLLISSIVSIQAQDTQRGTLRGYASGAAKRMGSGASAMVGGVLYGPQWVYRQIESGNFTKWGRRKIVNGLKRFSTPSAQEKVVLNKWIKGGKLTSEEAVLWRNFRKRALWYPKAFRAIVAIILTVAVAIAGALYVRGKIEAEEAQQARQQRWEAIRRLEAQRREEQQARQQRLKRLIKEEAQRREEEQRLEAVRLVRRPQEALRGIEKGKPEARRRQIQRLEQRKAQRRLKEAERQRLEEAPPFPSEVSPAPIEFSSFEKARRKMLLAPRFGKRAVPQSEEERRTIRKALLAPKFQRAEETSEAEEEKK